MEAKNLTVTAQDAINKMLDSFGLHKKGFRTIEEHLAFCQAIKTLFGDEIFENTISPAAIAEAMKRYPND